jgi:glycosyltransferase involved in cell wall biosynthesis
LRIGCRAAAYYLANYLIKSRAVKKIHKINPFQLIVCQSKNNWNKLKQSGIDNNIITHIPPGLDKSAWYPNEGNTSARDNCSINFLFFGPMRKARGIFILLQAFSTISRQYSNVTLTLLLRGANDAGIVHRKLQKLGIADKTDLHTGWMSQEQLREKIWNCTAVVIPFIMSESDMPLTILEAKACGKPVISTNVCSIPEMVGKGGIVIEPNSENKLAIAMNKIIEEPDCFETLVKYAGEDMAVYPDWNSSAKTFLKRLQDVI